jgi:VIT1/CCC1 family predicted Fe2+/Mn2+ transporter
MPATFSDNIPYGDANLKLTEAEIPYSTGTRKIYCEYKKGINVVFKPTTNRHLFGAEASRACLVIAPEWQSDAVELLSALLPLIVQYSAVLAFNLEDAVLYNRLCVVGQLNDFERESDEEESRLARLLEAARSEQPALIREVVPPLTRNFAADTFKSAVKRALKSSTDASNDC